MLTLCESKRWLGVNERGYFEFKKIKSESATEEYRLKRGLQGNKMSFFIYLVRRVDHFLCLYFVLC